MNRSPLNKFSFIVIVGLVLFTFYKILNQVSFFRTNNKSESKTVVLSENFNNNNQERIPAYVIDVLNYIRENKKPLNNYVGGRKFGNYEKLLPLFDDKNFKIKYQEWDVHPKIIHKNRGKERLITGSDGSAYYTKNHYRSFKLITNQYKDGKF